MTYTQIDFAPNAYPNVWERYYDLADGTVAVLSYCEIGEGDNNYSVIIHSEPPAGDWWDSVLKEVAYVDNLPEAEAIVAELTA